MSVRIGIRRETKTSEEQRVALPPCHVAQLLQAHPSLQVVVQPSPHRIFPIEDYVAAGASVQEDLSDCSLIIGVKEIGQEFLWPDKTYMCFPHVIKAQPANMQVLDHMVQSNIRLIDYERIVDQDNNRLIAFGKFAGLAGAIDFLFGLGQVLKAKDMPNQLEELRRCHHYHNLEEAKDILYQARDRVLLNGLFLDRPDLNAMPFILGVTGRGRCSAGVIEVLHCLGVEYCSPEEMVAMCENKQEKPNSIYLVQFDDSHMVQHKHGRPFDKKEYRSHPQDFSPIFHEKYLKYVHVLFHAMYWDQKFPRLVSDEQLAVLVERGESRLLGVCDITCDFQGSLEFCKKFTNVANPYYTYDPVQRSCHDGVVALPNGVLYESLDYLPAMLPFDASMHFGQLLIQWVDNIAHSDQNKALKEQGLVPEIERAVICSNASLCPDYEYISSLRNSQ